jgi:hypothetical protein
MRSLFVPEEAVSIAIDDGVGRRAAILNLNR